MKRTILIVTAVSILFTGCSYKNKIYKDNFQKKVETNRDNCTNKYATYNAYDSSIALKEKCDVTYNGMHTQTYDQYEFSTGKYIGGSIVGPLVGMMYFPILLIYTPFSHDRDKEKYLKESFIALTFPISGPFYRIKDDKAVWSPYELNKKKQNFQAEETLAFKDTVNIFPDKEIWIGDDKSKYPLQLNDNLSYHIPRKLVNYFCAKNYYNCSLTLYQRDDDNLIKFTTINITKGNQ